MSPTTQPPGTNRISVEKRSAFAPMRPINSTRFNPNRIVDEIAGGPWPTVLYSSLSPNKNNMHSKNLVWIDLEMTGLSPETDRIIEIATIITDSQLNILEEGPVIAVHQPLRRLVEMDDWNTNVHTKSGLINRVRESGYDERRAERMTIDFISGYVSVNRSPLCGNSICQDRRFLANYMPRLESYLHYRNLDVSSIKELMVRWRPDLRGGFRKRNTHRALDDIRESIEELKYYRKTFINVSEPDAV